MNALDRLIRDMARERGVTEEWVRNYYGITEEDK